MKTSASEFITLRGLQYHIRQWGQAGAPKLFMLHGWMDVSASFQFVVDCLQQDWHVIAPDWRGFGLTAGGGVDSYWFADYLGDLDALLDHYSPGQPVNLAGHSMGGNVAGIYAGVRPHRVRKLVNLEGIGMPPTQPAEAPARYAKWLDALRAAPLMRPYANRAEVAARLQKNNPRLSHARADFLSGHWAAQDSDGGWNILGDPAHKLPSPVLYRIDEVTACWQQITAPVLWIEAADSVIWQGMGDRQTARAEINRRMAFIADVRAVTIADAGHMLHHDQPEQLARLIEQFVA